MSLEQIINEDFYKNLFRLLHSPKPEATTELKKICDDLAAMYEARGITEYWPPIPGDSVPAGEGSSGSADFTPVSARYDFIKSIVRIFRFGILDLWTWDPYQNLSEFQ